MTPWLDRAVVETIFANTLDKLLDLARTKRERADVAFMVRNLEQTALQAIDCRVERLAALEAAR